MASTINAKSTGSGSLESTADASGVLALQTGGVTAVTVNTTQYVGINNTSPASSLDVTGHSASNGYYNFKGYSAGRGYGSYTNSSGTIVGYIGNGGGGSMNTGAVTDFGISSAGNLLFSAGGSLNEQMRIDSSGNVGIGVTPSSWGSGSQAIQNSSGSIWQYGSSNIYVGQNYYFNGTNRIYSTTAEASEYQQGAGLHRWFSAGSGTAGTTLSLTERMRITSDGTVRINCANYSTGPSSTSNGLALESNGGYPFWNHANTGTGLTTYYAFINGNGVVGTIRTTGSSTQFNTSSDYRLKENVHPMVGALDKVAQLNPVTYTWKTDGSAGQGFIAHELAEVVPECVSGEKDAVNEDGSINPQGIDTSHLVATLTAAIKEQQTIINDLKARIETLESK